MSHRSRAPGDHLDPLRAALRADPAGIAEALLGPPNMALSSRVDHRWRAKGSLSVAVAGPNRGLWHDHAASEGGDLLALIQREQRCSFSEAVAWAHIRTGIAAPEPRLTPKRRHPSPEPPPPPRQPDTEAADADAAAAEGRRIAFAQRLTDESAPLAGTLGETYLRQTRGIRRPFQGWPEAVRWHAEHRALLAVATLADGSVRAAQRIHINTDAEKISREELAQRGLRAVKQTFGVARGAVVRLPGDPAGPLLLAEGVETGLAVHTAGYETWVALGSVATVEPPIGRPVLVAADDDAAGSPAARALEKAVQQWRKAGVQVTVAYAWATRRHDKTDFANLILAHGPDAVRDRINQALTAAKLASRQPPPILTGPHYPRRPALAGDAASRRLRWVIRAFFNQLEQHFEIADWIAAEAVRVMPGVRARSEQRITENLIRRRDADQRADDFSPDSINWNEIDIHALAAERAGRVAGRVAKNAARRAAISRFGKRAAFAAPRVQIAGAAGLGKTSAFINEYLCRPSLWRRNIEYYPPTLGLGADFADNVAEALVNTPPAPDGTRPNIITIQGRDAPGMCHEDRKKLVAAAADAKITSIYRSCCRVPASEFNPELKCPHFDTCGYIKQFVGGGGLRILPHARLPLRHPADLPMPLPDLAVVDEAAIGTLVGETIVDPALLTERATYAADFGESHLIDEALTTGQAVVTALAEDGDSIRAMTAAGLTPERLRNAAERAKQGAAASSPAIHPAMAPDRALAELKAYHPHGGRAAAAVLHQLARDLETGRRCSTAVEWDAVHTAKAEDGKRVLHPTIRHHAIAVMPRVKPSMALLVVDADASLAINKRLFGAALRGFTIPAERQAYVVQVHDVSLADATLAPGAGLPNNVAKARRRRSTIAAFVASKVAQGQRVLAVTTKDVRRAFTDETEDRLPAAIAWQGAALTHYGRLLGIDTYRNHDTVIAIGRQQLPPQGAERIARAIYGDDPNVTLELPGSFDREPRRADLRLGLAPAVQVQVHRDPHVQEIVELNREQAMAQAIDRLRLIHRRADNQGSVFLLTNTPIPGLVVDEIMNLDDLLAGGSPWHRALARCGGVLPLSARWLSGHLADLFPSYRTAERAVADYKPPLGNRYSYCRMAVYKLAGQRRPSKVLVRAADVADPRAALAHLLGAEVKEFRWFGEDGPAPASAVDVPPRPSEMENSFRERPPFRAAPGRRKHRHPGPGKHRHPAHQNGGLSRNDLAALAHSKGGILPLSVTWLMKHHADLFPSQRTTERLVAEVTADALPPSYRIGLYRLPGQRCPSRALVRRDLKNPRAALERALAVRLKEFKMVTATGGRDTLDSSTSTRESTTRDAPEGIAREVIGGYGPLLDPSAMFPPTAGPAPPAMLLTIRGRAIGW